MLDIALSGSVTRYEDGFLAVVEELGIRAFGENAADAKDIAEVMLSMKFKAWVEAGIVESRLQAFGVTYTWVGPVDDPEPRLPNLELALVAV